MSLDCASALDFYEYSSGCCDDSDVSGDVDVSSADYDNLR